MKEVFSIENAFFINTCATKSKLCVVINVKDNTNLRPGTKSTKRQFEGKRLNILS